MAISSPGIGSGLDINGIIAKLMQVEQQPLLKLSTKEASYQSKISALGSLQGAVASLNSALAGLTLSANQTTTDKFAAFKASVADGSATATATKSAVPGSYSFEVVQLATNHRLSTAASQAQKIASSSFIDENVVVSTGAGSLNITVNGTTTTVNVTAGTTLAQLAQAINDEDAGVSATIADATPSGKMLVLTSDTPGLAGKITVTNIGLDYSFDYDSATNTGSMTQSQEAKGYHSGNVAIATGTLSLTVGDGTAKSIEITTSNNTLAGLRDAINNADAGVTATLASFGTNDVRLVLTSKTIGTAGKIGLSGLSGFTFNPTTETGDFSQAVANGGQPAQGSIVKLNGVTINGDSNTLTNAIDGVTLSLVKESTEASTLTVSRDNGAALNAAFGNIVKAYNDLNKTLRDLGKYDPETKQAGPLLGNSTMRNVANLVRNVFQSNYGANSISSYKRLSDLGLEVQRDGSINLNSSKLLTAANADFSAVADLAVAFGRAAKSMTDGMLGTKGTITAATDGAKASIKDIDRQREVLANRLTQIEARYRKQFTALDSLVASMNSTSSYLAQQLANLPKIGSSSSN